jgi:hypothetical protein
VGDELIVNSGPDGAKARQTYADGLTHIKPGSIRPRREFLKENCANALLEGREMEEALVCGCRVRSYSSSR